MEEIDSVRPTHSRALRAAALIVTSFAALVAGAVAAGGNLRLLAVIAGFAIYLFLFGRAVREFDVDRIVWDHPDSRLLLRVSGKSRFSGDRP